MLRLRGVDHAESGCVVLRAHALLFDDTHGARWAGGGGGVWRCADMRALRSDDVCQLVREARGAALLALRAQLNPAQIATPASAIKLTLARACQSKSTFRCVFCGFLLSYTPNSRVARVAQFCRSCGR